MATYDGSAYRLMVSLQEYWDEYSAIVGETSSTLNITSDVLEVTNKASAWKQYIAGGRGGTINATLYADDNDPMQKDVLNALTTGQKVYFALFRSKPGNLQNNIVEISGAAYISSLGFTCTNNAVATRDITLQVDGELNYFQE